MTFPKPGRSKLLFMYRCSSKYVYCHVHMHNRETKADYFYLHFKLCACDSALCLEILDRTSQIHDKILDTYYQMSFQNIYVLCKILYLSCHITFSCIFNVYKTSDIAAYMYTHPCHTKTYKLMTIRLACTYCLLAFYV